LPRIDCRNIGTNREKIDKDAETGDSSQINSRGYPLLKVLAQKHDSTNATTKVRYMVFPAFRVRPLDYDAIRPNYP
jgi:hypothetical protein